MKADSEAINFIRSLKRNQKILRARKWKRTWKRDTLKDAGSGSNKKLTAFTSLVSTCIVKKVFFSLALMIYLMEFLRQNWQF